MMLKRIDIVQFTFLAVSGIRNDSPPPLALTNAQMSEVAITVTSKFYDGDEWRSIANLRSWTILFIKMNEIVPPHSPRFTFGRFYAKLNTKRSCVWVRICAPLSFVLCMKCSSVYTVYTCNGHRGMAVAHAGFPSMNAVVRLALWILYGIDIFHKNTECSLRLHCS